MQKIIFIAGKDPLNEPGGGHSAYVCAFALAVKGMGFEPHLFCVARENEIVEAPYGVVHRIRSPLKPPYSPPRQLHILKHRGALVSAVLDFIRQESGPHLIHGFGVWGIVGILAEK